MMNGWLGDSYVSESTTWNLLSAVMIRAVYCGSAMKIFHVGRCDFLLCCAFLVGLAHSVEACGQQARFSQSVPRNPTGLKQPSVTTAAGPVIPGLQQGAVPQGIAFVPKNNVMLISHDFGKAASCVSVIDVATGKMSSHVTLQDQTKQPHYGHVGGIVAVKDSLFVASDERVLHYNLTDFVTLNPRSPVSATASWKSETKASFCTTAPGLLLVGEFAYGLKYRTKPSHHLTDRMGVRKFAWVCGYDVNHPMADPTCVLSVRQRAQGMCVSGDRVYLSISYGRSKRSLIAVYRNPIGKDAHQRVEVIPGKEIPLWFLDGKNYIGEIDCPPMSEGIAMVGDQLAVVFESGADQYQLGGQGPVDRVLLLDVSQF